jgi:hypothetical protein
MWRPSKITSLLLAMLSGIGLVVSLYYCDFENVKNGINIIGEISLPFVFLTTSINFFYSYVKHLKDERLIN